MPAARDLARLIGAGRIGAGVALLVAPRLVGRLIAGADAATPAASVLARALGVRDAVIGAMALHTLGRPEVAQRWQATCALVDAGDLAATLAVRRHVPRGSVAMMVAIAGGTALVEAWIARELAATSAAPPA